MVFFVKRAQDIALSTFIHMQGEGGGYNSLTIHSSANVS